MSILGVIVRVRPAQRIDVAARLAAVPGVDVALDAGDGRLVLVIEDAPIGTEVQPAAATMAAIATWPEMLATSLVYEHSGDDAAPSTGGARPIDYRSWRGSLKTLAAGAANPR